MSYTIISQQNNNKGELMELSSNIRTQTIKLKSSNIMLSIGHTNHGHLNYKPCYS